MPRSESKPVSSPTPRTRYRVTFERSVSGVDGESWDRCAGRLNPFVSHDFLSSLEESGCVGKAAGWIPFPALLHRTSDEELLAVAPCYIKLHSQGEYMFDYHWADAYERMHPPGEEYYPKLQVAVPFTPVPGPRLLVRPDLPKGEREDVRNALLTALVRQTDALEFSSVHVTFCQPQESVEAQRQGDFLQRIGEQYHWHNRGYKSWEDFLAQLTSRKRKNLKKERSKANSHPLKIHTFHGTDLDREKLLAFYRMYQTTSLQKWGRPYLNLAFFETLAKRLGDRLVLFLVSAENPDRWVAGAWNLRGEDCLFGRNWGCTEEYDLLHFEVCYYRAIEYAIEHKLARVEAGAQGVHKIGRGYSPTEVHSVHYIRSAPFRQAIADYLRAESEDIRERIDALSELEPFKAPSIEP